MIMKPLPAAFLVAVGASAAPSSKVSYARLMTDSMIRRGVEPHFHYDQATLYTSFESIYEFTGNETIAQFYRNQVDAIVLENGTIDGFNHSHYSLDNYRFGNNILWWASTIQPSFLEFSCFRCFATCRCKLQYTHERKPLT